MDTLLEFSSEKIKLGEELVVKLDQISYINGVKELQAKIRREIFTLEKLMNTKGVKIDQLKSTQMGFLDSVVECALKPGVIAVNKEFTPKVVVDIVSDEGRVWTKVVTKNPKYQSYATILEQAKKYLNCALKNLCMDEPPKVTFKFTREVDEGLAGKLEKLGVIVEGDIYNDASSSEEECYYYNSDSDYWCSD